MLVLLLTIHQVFALQSDREGEAKTRTSDLLLKSSSSSPSTEPCLHQGAATYLVPFVITRGTLNLMPLRIQRSLIPLRRPSTLPRLPLKTAAHSPPLLKR